MLIFSVLALHWNASAWAQTNKEPVRVEIVATASEYVPRSTTVSHPGHAYTDCLGSTSYFGRFSSYGDSGTLSGTADTNTHCSTTFSPPSETNLTNYLRVNYTIAESGEELFLFSCTQKRTPTFGESAAIGQAAGKGDQASAAEIRERATGKWSACPATIVGSEYAFVLKNASDARLTGLAGGKPIKLEYLRTAPLRATPTTQPPVASEAQSGSSKIGEAKVHVTSSPSGGEICVDGKFFGNTPSDITLAAGEHVFKVTAGGKEWTRTVQITSGEIRVHADIAEK
jgi:hypothetical protein